MRRSAWGDGLVEQSLATLWYCRNWADVDEDELIFYMPSLADWIEGTAENIRAPLPPTLEAILSSRRSTLRSLFSLIARGATEIGDGRQIVKPGHHTFWRSPRFPCSGSEVGRVVGQIDGAIERKSINQAPAGITCFDALLLSIHTQCNAAYVYPEFESCHAMFTCAAWVGLLVYGRPALLAPSIAEGLCDYLCPSDHSSLGGRSLDQAMQGYADWCVGRDRLLRLARRSAAGSIMAVNPRRFLSTQGATPSWHH